MNGLVGLLELLIGNESKKQDGFILRLVDRLVKIIVDIVKS